MSATCGQHSSTSSASADLTMCLGSKLQTLLGTVGSMEYRQTWKVKATPAGRQYWAHTASALPTSDKGYTGWPTTKANEKVQSPKANKKGFYSLMDVAKLTGWPTPTTGDSASSRNSTANRKSIPPTGIHKGDTLTDAATLAGWATPTARDWKSAKRTESEQVKSPPLSHQAHGAIQPIPTAETGKSGAFQLNPAFSLWLMGFPAEWASCGAAAMQSSRKSPRNSSKQPKQPLTTK